MLLKKIVAGLLLSLGGAGALVSWLGLTKPSGSAFPEKVEVWFSKKYSLADLLAVQNQLKILGVKLTYKQVHFNTDGTLSEIAFRVEQGAELLGDGQAKLESENFFGFTLIPGRQAAQTFYLGTKTA